MNSDFMGRFNAGNQQAFSAIFNEYFPRLSFFARRITNNEAEGQDIAINTFMKLWQRHGNFKTETNVKAFLYITARNACLDFLKQENRKQVVLNEWANYSEGWEPEHITTLIKGEMFAQLRAEVEELPKECKKILMMLFYEGKNTAEVAAELNISVNTVRRQRQIGIASLRKTNLTDRLLFGFLFLRWLEVLFRKIF